MIRLVLTASAALALSACVIDVDDDDLSGPEVIQANTALAFDQCGAGRVKSVDEDGFVCKGAGE